MPSTSNDDDDEVVDGEVVEETKDIRYNTGYDPRPDFLKGFADGREPPEAVTILTPEQRIEALERTVEQLEYRITRLERRFD